MGELLRLENIVKYFPLTRGVIFSKFVGKVHALDGASLAVFEKETLGLVGESGSGKTTLARVALGLIPVTSGKVWFEGKDFLSLSSSEIRTLRKDMQIVFQDSYASLNPRMTVEEIIAEPLIVHGVGTKDGRRKRAKELLEVAGLSLTSLDCYPHEFSGGERQRIGIARALSLNPKFVVLDEPISALDVSVQAQILNLLEDLQKEFSLTYFFISHDLSVVGHISDRVAVMYLGKLVELGKQKELYETPHHPYTQVLLLSTPKPDPKKKKGGRIVLKGDIDSSINPPSGCRFHNRCPIAQDICREKEPELKEVSDDHLAACHFAKPNPI